MDRYSTNEKRVQALQQVGHSQRVQFLQQVGHSQRVQFLQQIIPLQRFQLLQKVQPLQRSRPDNRCDLCSGSSLHTMSSRALDILTY